MQYTKTYDSPLGEILLAADEQGLTGLWFDKEKYFARNLDPEHKPGDLPALKETCRWLDVYFSGMEPTFTPPLHIIGTPFQKEVWQILLQIPYGETVTYGDIAQQIASNRGVEKMSAQAVGGAVGHNEISILIPCHRVVGANGSLTGYAGGVDKKNFLLRLEGVDVSRFSIPTKGTAIKSEW